MIFCTNLNLDEYNYEINNKELFVMIRLFKQLKPNLEEIKISIKHIANY